METGIAQGLEQLSLSLFTALTPAGTFAYIALTLYGLSLGTNEEAERRLHHYLIIPLAFCLIGLIASTNHLGKPANALYVLAGIGRSPLSNEVAASVVFTGLAWIYWLASFSDRMSMRRLRFVIPLTTLAGIAQIWFTANAYHVVTISSWLLPSTQINQILSAFLAGSFLFLLTLAIARHECSRKILRIIFLIMAFSTVLLLISEIVQSIHFYYLTSTTSQLTELFPQYLPLIALSTLFLLFAVFFAIRWNKQAGVLDIRRTGFIALLAFAGILVARFSFYCAYLNVGLVA